MRSIVKTTIFGALIFGALQFLGLMVLKILMLLHLLPLLAIHYSDCIIMSAILACIYFMINWTAIKIGEKLSDKVK